MYVLRTSTTMINLKSVVVTNVLIQAIGTIWDYTQTRKNSFHKGPQAISL